MTKKQSKSKKPKNLLLKAALGTACLIALAYLFPVYILLINSFKGLREIYLGIMDFPVKLNLVNYREAIDKLDFFVSIGNSLVITIASTLIVLLFTSMAAWVLVRYKTRKSKFFFMLFAAAQLIPFQCVMLPLVDLMGRMGLQNRPGMILMYLGFGSSMSVILFHGFIKNIPLELEEAALIDGCNPFQMFFLIVLPLLKTIMVTVTIINVMWIWNDFLLPQLMINKQGWQTLPLKTYLFFGQFSRRWDLATAALILCMIPIIVFYLICQKLIIKGVTEGAVKG
ncbi:MAG: carbohydrate ABC transporter permease [Treponema sp.]|jgi:raffinose/stachyose/melibiose transport system permease protein|nr:carbohydrate ABC transporter permease [Treponema sp.]